MTINECYQGTLSAGFTMERLGDSIVENSHINPSLKNSKEERDQIKENEQQQANQLDQQGTA